VGAYFEVNGSQVLVAVHSTPPAAHGIMSPLLPNPSPLTTPLHPLAPPLKNNPTQESFKLLDYALSRGVNFLDTAELYPVPPTEETSTLTEKIIGRWMAARGNRDQVRGWAGGCVW